MNEPWAARLNCGHQTRTPGKPRPGTWISCQTAGCRRQERVLLVWAAAVPEPGRPGIQATLWEAA